MEQAAIQRQKEKLTALKAELERAVADESGQAGIVYLDGSMGRVSRADALISQQMAKALQRRQNEQLLRVESALQRIEKGTYGQCLRCKQPVGEGRMELQPEATLCITCASRPRS